LSPEEIISIARENNLPSIAYTYSEPSVFLEFSLEVMKLAHKEGLKNIWVSNGFLSKECREKIAPFLDAINIDLKNFSESFYDKICNGHLNPVLDTIRSLNDKTHLEITTLLIPDYVNKDQLEKIAEFIASIDKKIPWHLTKFYSEVSWKMKDYKNTNEENLNQAKKIGEDIGLKYVYATENNTYCPNCNSLVIKRNLYKIKRMDDKGRCPQCNQKIF